MKHLFFMAGCLILLGSCKKEQPTKPPAAGEQKITIHKFSLKQYDNVELEASVKGFAESEIMYRGFCWSLSPDRKIGDSVYNVYNREPFAAQINSIGQNSRIYVRAFVETYTETYFSDSIVLNTSGVQLLWNKEYGGGKRRIKQVITSGNDGFLVLVERMEGVGSWPGLMKIDTSGHILWDREYFSHEIKTPQYLLPVSDGYLVATSQGLRSTGGILVFKVDGNGTKLWEKIFTRQTNDDFVRMAALPNQAVRLTARSYHSVANDKRVDVAIDDYVFDGDGQLLHSTSVPNSTSFSTSWSPIKAVTTADGGFVSVSENRVLSAGGALVVNKFNDANLMAWEQYCLRSAEAVSVSINNAGNYMVRAVETSNAAVMEIDKNSGELLWQYQFDVWKYGNAFGEGALAAGSDGYYIAADARVFRRPAIHGPLLVKLDVHGGFLYDYLQVVPGEDDLHYTDAVVTNGDKEIYLFGTRLKQLGDRVGEVYVIKLKER